MHLILFDIDGTLIDSGGAGTRSLNLALKELFSIENGFHGISMAGKTDTQIMKEGLMKHGISTNGNLSTVVDSYLRRLKEEINNDRKHIKPGVHGILEKLSLIRDVALGLLTGNLESGAMTNFLGTGPFKKIIRENGNQEKRLPLFVQIAVDQYPVTPPKINYSFWIRFA